MTVLSDAVEAKCQQELNATFVECIDNTDGLCDGNAKLELVVVSEQFQGIPLIKRHRAVNAALEEFMPQIHALTIKAWTPEQYETKKNG